MEESKAKNPAEAASTADNSREKKSSGEQRTESAAEKSSAEQDGPKEAPAMSPDGQCHLIVPKKRRRCRMKTKPGRLYCGEHGDREAGGPSRVPCPLDPKHTVDERLLPRHLTVCQARIPDQPWAQPDVNSSPTDASPEALGDPVPSQDLIDRVVAALASLPPIPLEELPHPAVPVDPHTDGVWKVKHLTQEASILAHMDKAGLLPSAGPSGSTSGGPEEVCVVELGAGKARLSSHLCRLLPPERASFVLVDRSGMQHKADNKAKRDIAGLRLKRIRCDIRHLRLSRVDEAAGTAGEAEAQGTGARPKPQAVLLWKHLCGNATDVGLRLLLRAAQDGLPVRGAAIVPCCHNKMELGDYVGWGWLEEQGFRAADFAALRTMCSWAVCGRRRGDLEETPQSVLQEEVGMAARALLQWGRVEFLRREAPFLHVRLVSFVRRSLTPENTLMIASTSPFSDAMSPSEELQPLL